jgi:hypothetical protein
MINNDFGLQLTDIILHSKNQLPDDFRGKINKIGTTPI